MENELITGNLQELEDLAELSGGTVEALIEWFKGMGVDEILAEANYCWPGDDNMEFAQRVFDALN